MSRSPDPFLLLGSSAAKGPSAPKGRNITAQGNALGSRHPTNLSPEGATQGWRITKISDFAKTTSGGTPSRANPEFYTGNIPWIKSGDLNDGNVSEATEFITEEALKSSSAKLFPAGTLMIALYGATIGKLGILTIDAATNQAVCGIFVPEGVETKYLFYFLLYHRPELIKQGAGGAQPNISQGIIRDIEVPLPPLPEQRRIVARIEELFSRLDAGVAALRHAKAQLQRYRQSVLAAAVTGQLTQAWREQHPGTEPASTLLERVLEHRKKNWSGKAKYKDPSPFAEGVFDALPPEWAIASLEALTDANRPICYGILMPKDNVPDGVLYVKVRDMRGDRINLESLQRTTSEIAAKYERASLKDGDLLLSIRGTYGRVALIPPELDGGNITQDSARLAVSDLLSRGYVACAIRSHAIQTHFKNVARGVAVKGVNIGDVKPTPIPIPPLAEQHQIVAEVEARTTAIDHLEAELDRQIIRSSRLRQSALAAAFSGNL